MKQIEESYLNKIAVINLVEETGRESILGDAFLEQVADSDSPNLTYVQFDFHEYWYTLRIYIHPLKSKHIMLLTLFSFIVRA